MKPLPDKWKRLSVRCPPVSLTGQARVVVGQTSCHETCEWQLDAGLNRRRSATAPCAQVL
jgi:hypothetical protein